MEARLVGRISALHTDVREVRTEVRATNGRLRKVEAFVAWVKGGIAMIAAGGTVIGLIIAWMK